MDLKKFTQTKGLPNGPNENSFSIEGYKADSPDRFNDFNIIGSGNITMENVPHPIMGIDNMGNSQIMFPEQNYNFPGDQVFEIPIRQNGGQTKPQVQYFDEKKFKEAKELYEDSLGLYNAYQLHNTNFNPYPYLQNVINSSNKYNGPYKGLTPEQALSLGKKGTANINNPGDLYKMIKKRGPLPAHGITGTNKGLYDTYKTMPFNRPVIVENDESPAIYHKNIRPVSQEFDGIGHHPVYQEPKVVPVYNEPIEPLQPREVNEQTLGLPPINILPIENKSKLKSGEYIMSDTEEQWFQTPSGTWYSRKKPVPSYIHNIHTGGNRKLQDGGAQKSEIGYREPLTGENRPDYQQSAFALLANQYGNVNYFAEMYNRLRDRTEESYLEESNLVDANGSLVNKTYDPDYLSKPYVSLKESKDMARDFNRKIRKEDLPYQKIKKNAFYNPDGFKTTPSFQDGGYIDMDLSDEEILNLRRKGYWVEEK